QGMQFACRSAIFDQRRSLCPRRYGCHRRLREIPQQVGRRQTILDPREQTMKIPLVVALVGLAVSLALPTFGQQKETVDPQIIEQLNALGKKYLDAMNNNDPAPLAALFTEDAVLLTDRGPVNGREAIAKWYVDNFQEWHHSNHVGKRD